MRTQNSNATVETPATMADGFEQVLTETRKHEREAVQGSAMLKPRRLRKAMSGAKPNGADKSCAPACVTAAGACRLRRCFAHLNHGSYVDLNHGSYVDV